MKSQISTVKGKASSRMGGPQAAFELKQRMVLALNKLADRDTCQIGVEELEKTIECLSHDGIAPFLSCILDIDSEQKCAVRKECIRLMGKLVTFHGVLVAPHLGRMVTSIVKRLKDTDSAVRDVCVETVGILASKLSGNSVETDSIFVVLVRPLFEALGEQNKQVQSGSALCLSRVIDNIHDPPPLVLQKMLARTIKLLKNPHFVAKPAAIELNRSIILAGGAPTLSSLSAAMTSIQEAMKNSEWATRKAACTALGDIASCLVSSLGTFRNTVICCLESCRFDKVKPVRDAALHALQLWKNLPGSVAPEPSETGSSIKGNECDSARGQFTPPTGRMGGASYTSDYDDVTSSSGSKLKDIKQMRSACEKLVKKRVPLLSRIAGRTNNEISQQSGTNDWQIEIAIPWNHNLSVSENHIDESEDSTVTKRCEKIYNDGRCIKNIGYNYVELDGKQEFSSASTLFTESIKSKVVPIHCDAFDDASLVKSTGTSQRFANDEAIKEQRYLAKMHDRRSLDSTVTESSSQIMLDCCLKPENDLVLIRKQLLDIENKQSNLMDILKAFTTTIADSMSMVQLKVSNLELVVDKIAQEFFHGGRYSDVLGTKVLRTSPSIVSPRLSGSTPRASVESNGHPPLPPTKRAGIWENTFIRGRSNGCGKQNSDIWSDAIPKLSNNSLGKNSTPASFCSEICESQKRTNGNIFDSNPSINSKLNKLEVKKNPRKVINDYIMEGDFDFAYEEALCSRNEFLLLELLDKTGPVLVNLSQKTANELLSTLTKFLSEQRFVNSIIPWFQQLVDLSNIHGPTYLALSAKLKRDLISSIQESVNVDGFNPAERQFFLELAKMMCRIWGYGPC